MEWARFKTCQAFGSPKHAEKNASFEKIGVNTTDNEPSKVSVTFQSPYRTLGQKEAVRRHRVPSTLPRRELHDALVSNSGG